MGPSRFLQCCLFKTRVSLVNLPASLSIDFPNHSTRREAVKRSFYILHIGNDVPYKLGKALCHSIARELEVSMMSDQIAALHLYCYVVQEQIITPQYKLNYHVLPKIAVWWRYDDITKSYDYYKRIIANKSRTLANKNLENKLLCSC